MEYIVLEATAAAAVWVSVSAGDDIILTVGIEFKLRFVSYYPPIKFNRIVAKLFYIKDLIALSKKITYKGLEGLYWYKILEEYQLRHT